MKRYNIFYAVHKGLRAFLYETAVQLQQTDFADPEASAATLNQVEMLIDLFEKHAHSEDTLVFAAIKRFEPQLVDVFEQEHIKDHDLGEKLVDLLKEYDLAKAAEEKEKAGSSINGAFIDFMIFNLEHMAKEEDIINKALWKYYTDVELSEITQKIISNISPAAMALFSKWMIRGLSNHEITAWFKDVKHNAPDAVFQSLLHTASLELAADRFQFVQGSVLERTMVA